MKTGVLDFPIKHIDGNLVFSKDGTVTAYYEVSGFNYDFLDHDDKLIPFQSQTAFLFNNKNDLHFMLEPFPSNIEEILGTTIEDIKMKNYLLKDNGIRLMEATKEALSKRKEIQETSEYLQFIGVQLIPDLNKYKDANAGLGLISSIKEFFKGVNAQINRANGLHSMDILEEEIKMWKDQSETAMDSIRSAFNCNIKELNTAQAVYLLEKEFSVMQSNSDIKKRRNFTTGEKVEGLDDEGRSQRAIRPKETAFFDLQNTNIEEDTPTSLIFRKEVNDEVKEMHVKYLVAHSMDSENYFPNFEWLYNIQSRMNFPISVSVRHITKRMSV
ncbi:hypothetical protein JCM21714_2083 [Gracilibacillus boraciitolerans JCM 21714]|uniref:Uncharacterized protein n=1 Tax=Gracilibacillus boraciitolerans JCM 21714 TaxID=1298598 RepID=W4VJV3_9BACI|nr:hypothetical protein [Gracilibacillus boraciitolerans]GAE93049.1 hypothetical protein JCM21714_2083 [Gracilibacillus boraciitolerans JCM 21714]